VGASTAAKPITCEGKEEDHHTADPADKVGGVGVWPTPADFEGGGRTNIEGVDSGVGVDGRSAER